jgi:hypothetical protein
MIKENNIYKILIIVICLLNIFDLFCTQNLYDAYGASIELNPIGVIMLQNTPLLIVGKIMGVGTALCVLWANRARIMVRSAAVLLCAIYSVLSIYHIFIVLIIDKI